MTGVSGKAASPIAREVLAFIASRYEGHKADRREAIAAADDYSQAFAVGAMLELLEVKSEINRIVQGSA